DRGHSLTDFRAHVEKERPIVMGVDVDEPRRDHESVDVDLAPTAAARLLVDGRDAIAVDGDIRPDRRGAGAVDYTRAAEHQIIICHCLLPSEHLNRED